MYAGSLNLKLFQNEPLKKLREVRCFDFSELSLILCMESISGNGGAAVRKFPQQCRQQVMIIQRREVDSRDT